jgi:hypothetical protein
LVLLLAIVVLATGCAAKDGPTSKESAKISDVETSTNSTNANTQAPALAQSNATANSNTTTDANTTKPSDMPSDPSNCMRGMNMDGCTAAQADAYFDSRKVNPPPPDKELPPVVIVLDTQGANPSGAFTLDAGTMTLMVQIYLNDTAPGPYAAVGPGGVGDLTLSFVGPKETTTYTIKGPNVGVDPADPLADKFTTMLEMPAVGDWALTLDGQGSNTQLEIRLVERF